MKKRGKRISIQQKFRNKKFSVDQYWNLTYTERDEDGAEKDYKTIIKAQSYEFAKKILKIKIAEDNPSIQLKAIQGNMFHKNYRISSSRKTLGLKEWEEIRASSFPNENNFLFKIEVPRASWKTNRFNGSGKNNMDHIKKYGFKPGSQNWSVINVKGKVLSEEERSHKLFIGKWVDWDEEERNKKKQEIINALVESNNVRVKAAEKLNIDRNKLYKLFKKFPEVDFAKEYPAPPPPKPTFTHEQYVAMGKKGWNTMIEKGTEPFGGKKNTPEANKKRVASRKKHYKEKKIKFYKKLEPKIREAFEKFDNNRVKAAQFLNLKESTFRKYLHDMKKEMGINWSEEYPTIYCNERYRPI